MILAMNLARRAITIVMNFAFPFMSLRAVRAFERLAFEPSDNSDDGPVWLILHKGEGRWAKRSSGVTTAGLSAPACFGQRAGDIRPTRPK
jgi:hypothetical protein